MYMYVNMTCNLCTLLQELGPWPSKPLEPTKPEEEEEEQEDREEEEMPQMVVTTTQAEESTSGKRGEKLGEDGGRMGRGG